MYGLKAMRVDYVVIGREKLSLPNDPKK